MQLWQDGLLAMLAAIGLGSLMWAAVKLVAFPAARGRHLAVAVVPASGDGTDLEAQIRCLVQLRKELGAFGRIVIIDCGLDDGGRQAAELLAKGNQVVSFCQKEDILKYIP